MKKQDWKQRLADNLKKTENRAVRLEGAKRFCEDSGDDLFNELYSLVYYKTVLEKINSEREASLRDTLSPLKEIKGLSKKCLSCFRNALMQYRTCKQASEREERLSEDSEKQEEQRYQENEARYGYNPYSGAEVSEFITEFLTPIIEDDLRNIKKEIVKRK